MRIFVYSVSRAARYPSSGASPKGTNCAPARYSPTASSQSFSKSVSGPPRRASAPASAAGPSRAQAVYYTVVSGDTLWAIAKQYGVELAALIRANPQIKNPNLIYPGEAVKVP